jgi:hypothetical protein
MKSLCVSRRHVCESGGTAPVILNLSTLPNLYVGGKEPLRHIQYEDGCGPNTVLMSTEQRYTFKDNASLCFTSARHLAHLPSTEYRISWGWDSVVKFRYL